MSRAGVATACRLAFVTNFEAVHDTNVRARKKICRKCFTNPKKPDIISSSLGG